MSKSKFRKKSDIDQGQEGPITWPREKSAKESAYEIFLQDVLNPKTGEFYPQKDENGLVVKDTGCTYYITDIYRTRKATGEEYLFTKGIAYAFNSLGDPINHSISKPELWTKVIFYKTEYNDKTKQMEKVLQGPSGAEEIYTLPFTKENLKPLYDRRQNDLLNLVVKDEPTGKAIQVKDVTGNITKSYEIFRDNQFDYLFTAEYVPKEIKAEARMEAVSQGLIRGGAGDYTNMPASKSTGSTTAKNTYQ